MANEPMCPRCDSENTEAWDTNDDDFITYVCLDCGMEFDSENEEFEDDELEY